MPATRNALDANARQSMIALLNARLADTLDLATVMKHAHWNVNGPRFIALHEMFDAITDAVRIHADDIAERAVALGGVANGRTQDISSASTIAEYPADATGGAAHVEAIANSIATVTNAMRGAIDEADEAGDAVTADLFTGVVRDLDKQLWFVEAHLAKD